VQKSLLVVASVQWQSNRSDNIGQYLPVPVSIAAGEFFGLLNQCALTSVYKHAGRKIKLKLQFQLFLLRLDYFHDGTGISMPQQCLDGLAKFLVLRRTRHIRGSLAVSSFQNTRHRGFQNRRLISKPNSVGDCYSVLCNFIFIP